MEPQPLRSTNLAVKQGWDFVYPVAICSPLFCDRQPGSCDYCWAGTLREHRLQGGQWAWDNDYEEESLYDSGYP